MEILFKASFRVDGVRHLWFEESEDGYMYCPDMVSMIELFQKVREIEVKCCPRAD